MFGTPQMPMDERYVRLMNANPQAALGAQAMDAGSSTDPVSSPWAGLARVLQGAMGGIATKNAGKAYYAAADAQAKKLQAMSGKLPIAQRVALALQRPGEDATNILSAPDAMPQPDAGGGPPANPMLAPAAFRPGPMSATNAATPSSGVSNANFTFEQFKHALDMQETGGRYGIPNAEGSGATGRGQIMPNTAKRLSARLGIAYRPDLQKGSTGEAKRYQDMLFDAAAREAWEYGKGNPITSAKYYFAGPDQRGWGSKTSRYGREIAIRLANGGALPKGAKGAWYGGGAETAPISGGEAPPSAASLLAPVNVPDAPALPERPSRPAPRPAPASGLLDFGRQMLDTGDQSMMAQGMELVTKGLQEQYDADREAIAREYGLDAADYSAANEDYYGSRRDDRQNRLAERRDATNYNRDVGIRNWERGNQVEDREAGYKQQRDMTDIEHNNRLSEIQAEANAQFNNRIAELTLKSSLTTQQKRQDFFLTPSGQKLQDTAQANISKAAEMDSLIQEFMGLNSTTGTGGVINMMPGLQTARSNLESNVKRMDAINARLSQMLHEQGTGAWSDKDQELAGKAMPNTAATYKTNEAGARTILRANARIQDYWQSRLLATADGNSTDFIRDWSKYINEVSVFDGSNYISYDQWKTLPTLPTQGKRRE